MKRSYFLILVACVAALSFVSCKNGNNTPDNSTEPIADYAIRQFPGQPFLGETYISDYDYEAGNRFLLERYKEQKPGACSSFRNGDFAARNLDWYVRDYAVLVVHTAANKEKGRYASVGIVSSNPFINRAMIAGGEVKDVATKDTLAVENWRNIFPIFTTDGINEKGLCANVNIVMHEEDVRDGYVKCTGGNGPYLEKTSFVSLVRYILDNCATCQEAIDSCKNLHVTQAFAGALAYEDNHIMVSDKDETVILEWYNDKMQETRFPRTNGFKCGNMPAIMTNFYNYIGKNHTNSDGSINLEGLLAEHPYAMGVERYEIIRKGWNEATTAESAKALISNVFYSKYFDFNAKWYTENGMFCAKAGNDWYYPSCCPFKEKDYVKAESLLDAIHKMYAPENSYMVGTIAAFGSLDEQMRNLDAGIEAEDNWYTELTAIYDIPNHILQIMPQEGWYGKTYYPFTVLGDRAK